MAIRFMPSPFRMSIPATPTTVARRSVLHEPLPALPVASFTVPMFPGLKSGSATSRPSSSSRATNTLPRPPRSCGRRMRKRVPADVGAPTEGVTVAKGSSACRADEARPGWPALRGRRSVSSPDVRSQWNWQPPGSSPRRCHAAARGGAGGAAWIGYRLSLRLLDAGQHATDQMSGACEGKTLHAPTPSS